MNFDPVKYNRGGRRKIVQALQKEQKQTWIATLDNDLAIVQNCINFEIKTSEDKQQFNLIDAPDFTLRDLFHSSTQNLKKNGEQAVSNLQPLMVGSEPLQEIRDTVIFYSHKDNFLYSENSNTLTINPTPQDSLFMAKVINPFSSKFVQFFADRTWLHEQLSQLQLQNPLARLTFLSDQSGQELKGRYKIKSRAINTKLTFQDQILV